MIPMNLTGYEVELNSPITKRYAYDDAGNRSDIQASDDEGMLMWGTTISLYEGDNKEGDYRLTIHSPLEPHITGTGRHPLIKLRDPRVNIWQGADGMRCTIQCWGIEDDKPASEGAKK